MELSAAIGPDHGPQLATMLDHLAGIRGITPDNVLTRVLLAARDQRAVFAELACFRMEWDPVFASIAAARGEESGLGPTTDLRLKAYAEDASWANLSTALRHILRGDDRSARRLPLDHIDLSLLRRCHEVLDGRIALATDLPLILPISGTLSRVLHAAQNHEPESTLTQSLLRLHEIPFWKDLVPALRRIVAGNRDSTLAEGCPAAHATAIRQVLRNLAP